jgi:putative heme-binding domain-containing protein
MSDRDVRTCGKPLAIEVSRQMQRFLVGLLLAALCGVASVTRGEAIGKVTLPPGFRAELVYSVPMDQQGSWVCLTIDAKGRLLASDQYGSLYRVEPAPLGAEATQTKVERIEMTVGNAQGLLALGDALYVVMNGRIGSFGPGLYRLTDSNNDDRYDRLEQLRSFQGEGEHGPHAVVAGPDGKSLYVICGNATGLPFFDRSLVPQRWGEDQVLPRIQDPMGQTNALKAPGGWVARMDLNGGNLELFSVGYRNAYDLAFNGDGELFTFDSDMEWDIGTPWYRPTRICHVVSGSDYGWRPGDGLWPQYFIDTLRTTVDVGPGSPTGLAFGAGTKFPERYQRALFAGDWSYGNIYAIHMTEDGASYRGEVERFASAMPLGVTDMVVRPQDGALYFTVGGRKSESALYRIVADDAAAASTVAAADSAAAVAATPAASPAKLRELRHWLENLQAGSRTGAIDAAWPYLKASDRFVRFAARVAIEQQPVAEWRTRALAEPSPRGRLQALTALARYGSREDLPKWVDALVGLKYAELTRDEQLDYLRTAQLGLIRFEAWDDASKQKIIAALDSSFPAGDHRIDRELAGVLIRTGAPKIIERLLARLKQSATQEESMDLAVALSAVTNGWTAAECTQFLDWFDEAASLRGGQSSFPYLVSARNRFLAVIPATERGALGDRLNKPLVQPTGPVVAATARPLVREYTFDEVAAFVEKDAAEKDTGERDLANGRRMFSAATCYNCHRLAGEGSSVGPDLTGVGGRFGVRDIVRSIVDPNREVSDQYRQMVFETNGRVLTGRVTNMNADGVYVSTDMLDPKKEILIRREDIDEQYPSETSLMPEGLLNTLTESEILDLLAYLRSGGVAEPAKSVPPAGTGGETAAAAATP